jgi:hypothetical protein
MRAFLEDIAYLCTLCSLNFNSENTIFSSKKMPKRPKFSNKAALWYHHASIVKRGSNLSIVSESYQRIPSKNMETWYSHKQIKFKASEGDNNNIVYSIQHVFSTVLHFKNRKINCGSVGSNTCLRNNYKNNTMSGFVHWKEKSSRWSLHSFWFVATYWLQRDTLDGDCCHM